MRIIGRTIAMVLLLAAGSACAATIQDEFNRVIEESRRTDVSEVTPAQALLYHGLGLVQEEEFADAIPFLEEAISRVTSMSTTHAIRNTVIDGEKIENGQILGLINGSIECVANNTFDCLSTLADKMTAPSFITLFYGADASEDDAVSIETMLRQKHPTAEIATINGGQPIYDFILSVE